MKSLVEDSIVLHEWFLSLLEAGFEEDQALKLIAYVGKGNND